jgi:predicted nucleotidyltransferase
MSLYTNCPWAKDRVILLAKAGSHAYGTNTPTSDLDYRGILIPTVNHFFGLNDFESYHSPEDTRDGEDIVVYSLKKYAQLALSNNPNVLEMLFGRTEDYMTLTDAGKCLILMRYDFLSKKVFKTFSGYALAQLHRMTQNEGKPTHGQGNPERQKVREEFGYDTKAALHLVRLMRMGIELLRDGELKVYREDYQDLLDIKHGKRTLQDIVSEHDALYQDMLHWYDHTFLPEEPNFNKINKFIVELTQNNLIEVH